MNRQTISLVEPWGITKIGVFLCDSRGHKGVIVNAECGKYETGKEDGICFFLLLKFKAFSYLRNQDQNFTNVSNQIEMGYFILSIFQ